MGGIRKRTIMHCVQATFLSFAFVVTVIGCTKTGLNKHVANEYEVASFVDQLSQLGIDARMLVGYETCCEITFSDRKSLGLLPNSDAIPLRYHINSMSLDEKDIETLFVNRTVSLFNLTNSSMTPEAFKKLSSVGDFGEFSAEELSFTDHNGGPTQDLFLDLQFLDIKKSSLDVSKAMLPSIGSTRNFSLDTDNKLHVELNRFQKTDTLFLAGCEISLSKSGEFKESPLIQTLVFEDSDLSSSVIVAALELPSLRTIAITRCRISDLRQIDFPTEVSVVDFIVDDAEMAAFFRERVSSNTSVNGEPGLKKVQ